MSQFRIVLLLVVLTAVVGSARAQAPTGTIAGLVTDPAGSAVAARITVTNRSTGFSRNLFTSEGGDYSLAALTPGDYRVTAEAAGFKRLEISATVEAGTTTTVDLQFLEVGAVSEVITVDYATPHIQRDNHQVGGLISRNQIENLPLNGRSVFDLAKLEPGVQPPARSPDNRTFVPALGQPVGNSGRGTRVTVDGGSIMAVGNGGSHMAFSQEVVHEFQLSTVNFDLSTGITNGAAINVVTRSGGNELHGTGFYFFRDHTLAAHPALNRDADPEPFFQRRQFGFALGGPIRRDRMFFFGNYERNEQRGVATTTLVEPEFTHLSRITPSPYFGNQLSVRLDGRLSTIHTAFVRYSHDGVRALAPPRPNALPSSWLRQLGWVDQSILGVTSAFSGTLVNDFRFSYFFVRVDQVEPTEKDCPGCLGIGAPFITIAGVDLSIGRPGTFKSPGRRYHLSNYMTWQLGPRRARFGVDWEYNRGGVLSVLNEPASLTLYSPQAARLANLNLPLPSAFRTLDDILHLPLQRVTVGIGDPHVTQEDGGLVRNWHTLRLFFQETWRLDSRLTINYGVGWSIDRNLNYDLTKPELLIPILGVGGLGPTRKQWKNFSPVLGLVFAPSRGKSVIRAGAGIYYDFLFATNFLDQERALLGPPGLGRQTISGDRLLNCLPDIPGVPVGTALNFPNNTPTRFTGANMLACLPTIRAELVENLSGADQSIKTIQLVKQASGLNPVDVPSSSAIHVNLGIQREVARDFVVSADFAYRHFDHVGLGQLDLNRFNSMRGPVIPKCTEAQRNDPQALCSTGPINVQINAGRATYKGLLVRADKRFSHSFQLLGSWAFSSNTGTVAGPLNAGPLNVSGNGFDLDDWLSNRGPLATDFTHIVNLAGVVQLPWRLKLGFNFSYSSAPPFSAFVGGIDFNGDGTTNDLLPGTTVHAFNRGLGRVELSRLVAQFNQTHAGRLDAKGAPIPRLVLPDRYWFGDSFQSLDLRLSREFTFEKRWRFALIGEVFNLYNSANLSGHSGNLSNAAFGQPTSRATQVFGSGGTRAFQLGARVSF